MVSKLEIKGLIPRTERRKKSEILQARKKAKNPNTECLWVTGTINKFTNNEILDDL